MFVCLSAGLNIVDLLHWKHLTLRSHDTAAHSKDRERETPSMRKGEKVRRNLGRDRREVEEGVMQ